MRLWSISPKYLDRQGLLAVWREGLLAKKVLANKTKGYKNHPQLNRFKESDNPLKNIDVYLYGIFLEAKNRNYKFDINKIDIREINKKQICVTKGQILYEFNHLLDKLKFRDFTRFKELDNIVKPELHFIFKLVQGDIERWEKLPKK